MSASTSLVMHCQQVRAVSLCRPLPTVGHTRLTRWHHTRGLLISSVFSGRFGSSASVACVTAFQGPEPARRSCHLIERQPHGRLEASAHIEQGDERSGLVDRLLIPPDDAEGLQVALCERRWGFCQLLRIGQQRARFGVQIIRRPQGRKCRGQVLICQQAANCRRMRAESGSPPIAPLTTVAIISRWSRESGERLRSCK